MRCGCCRPRRHRERTSYLENADYWITTSAGTWGWILVGGIIRLAAGFDVSPGGLSPLARNPHRDGFGGRSDISVRAVVGLDDHLHRPVGHPFAVRTSTLTRLSLITSVVLSAWLCGMRPESGVPAEVDAVLQARRRICGNLIRLSRSRSTRWSATRSAFAMAVNDGLTAPILGKAGIWIIGCLRSMNSDGHRGRASGDSSAESLSAPNSSSSLADCWPKDRPFRLPEPAGVATQRHQRRLLSALPQARDPDAGPSTGSSRNPCTAPRSPPR